MNLSKSIKQYFRGSSKDEKVHKFEELENIMTTSRLELDIAVKGLNALISNVDEIKKSANIVIGTAGVNPENVSVALDNMRYSNEKLNDYMDGFAHTTRRFKEDLEKAEKDMIKLIESNPDMASIIVDVKHDQEIEESLEVVFKSYKSKEIDRKVVINAYKAAVDKKRTDRDFSILLDKYL